MIPLESMASKLSVASMEDLDDHVLSDCCFFIQSLIALVTGKGINDILPCGSESNPYQRSSFLAFCTASEMIRCGISRKPGILQDLLQKHLSTYQTPQAVADLLTRYRIAALRKKNRLKTLRRSINRLKMAGKLTGAMRYGLVFIIYDNLRFCILGAKAGYDQYTMILVFFITP